MSLTLPHIGATGENKISISDLCKQNLFFRNKICMTKETIKKTFKFLKKKSQF